MEKCQWLGTRPEGALRSRGRALKVDTGAITPFVGAMVEMRYQVVAVLDYKSICRCFEADC